MLQQYVFSSTSVFLELESCSFSCSLCTRALSYLKTEQFHSFEFEFAMGGDDEVKCALVEFLGQSRLYQISCTQSQSLSNVSRRLGEFTQFHMPYVEFVIQDKEPSRDCAFCSGCTCDQTAFPQSCLLGSTWISGMFEASVQENGASNWGKVTSLDAQARWDVPSGTSVV